MAYGPYSPFFGCLRQLDLQHVGRGFLDELCRLFQLSPIDRQLVRLLCQQRIEVRRPTLGLVEHRYSHPLPHALLTLELCLAFGNQPSRSN